MNKKKSKCCCIYEKPRKFDESESESSDDECEHCFGHVEKKRQHRTGEHTTTINDTDQTEGPEPTATLSLQPPEPAPTPPDKPLPAS